MGRVMVQPLEGLQMGATGLYAIRLSLGTGLKPDGQA